MLYDVFISYSTKDKQVADSICAYLEQSRIRCFVAPKDIRPGQEYAEAIIYGIKNSQIFVMVFSQNANASPHVAKEVERAINYNCIVIPFRIENITPAGAMEYYLSTPHWLDAMSPPLENHILNLRKTVENLLKSANKVNPEKEIHTGLEYNDQNNEFNRLKAKAEQGNAEAQCKLGICYQTGNGVEKNIFQAIYWYQKAAEQGMSTAQCNLGCCYQNGDGFGKDDYQAVHWYAKAAAQGQADAQCYLANLYRKGQGIAKDEKLAFYWYNEAANKGQISALNNLGFCYRTGIGTKKDERQAVLWYRRAAEQGHILAQFNLGECYLHGLGVIKDKQQAIYWYSKAAQQGYEEAAQRLKSIGA